MASVIQVSVQVPPAQNIWKQFLKTWWLLVVLAVLAAAGTLVGAGWLNPQVKFLAGKDLDLARALTPLAMAAIFIERAVEVLISPWREAATASRVNAVKAAAAASESPATDENVQDTLDSLNQYKGNTKKVAFLLAFLLSLVAALAGVRALGPFLADDKLTGLTAAQQHLFWGYDVFLTSVLLPGGADLVHTIFNAFSSVFNKVQQSAGVHS
ncbi:MAG TPA: hypothetical protein VL991_12475 [Terracidiphilus sp.]|jgi:hypothetical protein|nr:hypothetical protein [Terracidiphilus sp.]